MSHDQASDVRALRELLRIQAAELKLDPASITSPSPNSVIATASDGSLLRLDVSRYEPMEPSL
jgi:hypothetical protein